MQLIITKLLGLLAFMSLLGFSPANADTIYTYTGYDFTTADAPYTTTDKVTGTIDLAVALVDDFGPGAISPVSFSFSDGVQTLTNSNSAIAANVFETNSAGTIVQWAFEITENNGGGVIFTASGPNGHEDEGRLFVGDLVFNGINAQVAGL